MPHCCPQKQQWVLTSFSGSPPARTLAERCGPKRSVIARSSTGTWAMSHSPRRALRQSEERAPAARTDALIVLATFDLVAESQVALDGDEVADHRRRRVRLGAARAHRLLAPLSR